MLEKMPEERKGILTSLEKRILGETWATERMSFQERVDYFRKIGQWPGLHTELIDRMFLESDINSAIDPACKEIKKKTAKTAGFTDLAE